MVVDIKLEIGEHRSENKSSILQQTKISFFLLSFKIIK